MWVLKKHNDDTTRYLISDQHSYSVGRKNCDINLPDDKSVSRKHCTIYIAKKNDCPFGVNTSTGVWIADEESKYGTYVKSGNNWKKLNPKENEKLSHGSVVRFGVWENIWSLEYKPVIACASGIQLEQKKKLENILKRIDGELRNVWCKECSLVVVNEITLTIKVVLALINGIPIVTQNYVPKMVENVINQTAFPNYEEFKPTIKESFLDASLVSLDIKNTRKELFKGKRFVLPTKRQYESLKDIILSAGGEVELFSCGAHWKSYAKENVVLIQLTSNSDTLTQEMKESFEEVASHLKNIHEMRVIPESEIAQAVAYSSVEKYCNPKSTCFNLRIGTMMPDLGDLLVEETPDVQESNVLEACIIPSSSLEDSQADLTLEPFRSTIERKRIHSPEQLECESQKKKARNEGEEINAPSLNVPLVHKEVKPSLNKAEEIKLSLITKYFKTQIRSQESSLSSAEDHKKFWGFDEPESVKMKRKLSSEIYSAFENIQRKKMKLPTEDVPPPSEVIEERPRQSERIEKETPNHKVTASPPKRFDCFQEENDFRGFIEREKTEVLQPCIDDLNKTIFSLTLISSAYLKEDGSLIDPPSVPVNVKQFRKQKVNTPVMVTSLEQSEEELSAEGWIEPRQGRLEISAAEEYNW